MPKVAQLEIEELGFEPRQSESKGLLILPGGPRMRSLGGGSTLLLLDGNQAPIPTLLSSWTETGNYTCEFCGKQYKYYTPYQEHVALHAPISEYLLCLGEGRASHRLRLWSFARGGRKQGSTCAGGPVSRYPGPTWSHLPAGAGKVPPLS